MIVVVLLTAGIFYAPVFLAYSTSVARADAVILLLGPDFSARQKHAYDLMGKGMADYLIISAYNKTYVMDQGKLKYFPNKTNKNNISGKSNPAGPWYYEDTHLEIIAAKKTMQIYGRKSAIFVSSPYHMRRIQLMVDKEFGPEANHNFSPTPYEAAPLSVWDLKSSDWRRIWREYVKILWFVVYSPWT